MKIEDAIEYLEDINAIARTRHMCRLMDGKLEDGEAQMYRRRLEAVKMAIQALKKQIPKELEYKVKEQYSVIGKGYYCQCGALFPYWENIHARTNYCGNCGQRLK